MDSWATDHHSCDGSAKQRVGKLARSIFGRVRFFLLGDSKPTWRHRRCLFPLWPRRGWGFVSFNFFLHGFVVFVGSYYARRVVRDLSEDANAVELEGDQK